MDVLEQGNQGQQEQQHNMDGKTDVKALMAKFGNKSAEETSSLGSRPVRFTPQSSLQGDKPSVASKAAGFETSAGHKFQTPRTTGSFNENSNRAAPKPFQENKAFPKPSALKAQFEGLNKEANDCKPVFPKSTLGAKPSLNTFSAQKAEKDEKAPFPKPQTGLRPTLDSADSQKENEVRPGFSKQSPFSKPLNPVTSHESKPVFPKSQFPKPPNSHSGNVGEDRALKPAFSKPPAGPKPWNEASSTHRENKEGVGEEETSTGRGDAAFGVRSLRPVSERGRFLSHGGEDKASTTENKSEPLRPSGLKNFPPKPKQEEASALPPGTSNVQKLQSQFLNKSQSQETEERPKDPSAPKRRALPAPWTLGAPPQKPKRPPTVNLDLFHQPHKKEPPAPPVSNRLANKPLPTASPSAPNLPPRPPIGKPPEIIPTTEQQEDENYDDVQSVGQLPPPLPPMKPEDRKIPASSINSEEKDDSDGEMYEDLDNYRSLKELKEQEKKREKEEKRRQEQERKEQKEKEKREQEMRKKFKLSGPIEIIQTVKVTMDYRGGKNELSCKQGDCLEIIRITDNPEGKWLARTLDGSYGYIKVTCVDINYDEIRKKTATRPTMKQPVEDQELYDDVAPNDDIGNGSGSTGGSGLFPPPPPPSTDDIYDDVDGIPEDIKPRPASQDASKTGSWSWGLLKKKKVEKDEKDKKAREKESSEARDENGERQLPSIPPPAELPTEGEDVYDDVGADDFPPPPPESSLPKSSKLLTTAKGKKDEKDPKKNKKMEKEEKDFRKKFKYDGEIRVLGTVEVVQNLTAKKWANRELPVKAGEVLDIIQHTDNTKLLCRNEEGKFGYVQKINLDLGNKEGDGEIYDDIDTECIYDND
ncbi:FYN-binding protein 1 isoform X1 [Hemiscyllium ocellatum]|uniref:FYN-binding protein 1 isoform X1 n=2 Tax=Hemiscyllium ocellatum TaxID=170820 RepID=UPI002967468E|nr:FYN-binding protein 1 isoform X1 [Hemiscyllium ocellatum]